MADSACPRVNASMLPSFMGMQVTLVGRWSRDAQGQNVITASDGGIVNIQLPPGEDLDGRTFVQVVGKVISTNHIDVFHVLQCPGTDDFDLDLYNKAIVVCQQKFPHIF